MTSLTHTAAGYLIAKVLVHSGIIPPSLEPQAITAGIIAANGPDFDGLAFWRVTKHRIGSPLHYPVFWLLVLMPASLYSTFTDNGVLFAFTSLVVIGVFSHFILDTIDFSYGIAWLWPFSKKYFHLWKKFHQPQPTIVSSLKQYLRNPSLIPDLAFSIITFLTSRGGR